MMSALALWRDRRGRVSVFRILVLALFALPIVLAVVAATGEDQFDARPVNDLIHRAGFWTLMFLLLALSVTPLARITRLNGLIDVRRMLGVGAFCYAAAHISLYVVDQMFDLVKVASEIVLRFYLTIGFTALIGRAGLAATSTDGMVRRLGAKRWQRLHQIVYGIGLLALVHFFQQTKADVWVPTFVAGLFTWLMGYRLVLWRWATKGNVTPLMLLTLAVVVSALTFAGEAVGIGFAYHVSPLVVLQTAFDFDFYMVRPGWLVLGAGLCVVVLDLAMRWWRGSSHPRVGRPAPATIATPPSAPVSAKSARELA
jgi:sulfoxide reductase heme-binding subunit YedZ